MLMKSTNLCLSADRSASSASEKYDSSSVTWNRHNPLTMTTHYFFRRVIPHVELGRYYEWTIWTSCLSPAKRTTLGSSSSAQSVMSSSHCRLCPPCRRVPGTGPSIMSLSMDGWRATWLKYFSFLDLTRLSSLRLWLIRDRTSSFETCSTYEILSNTTFQKPRCSLFVLVSTSTPLHRTWYQSWNPGHWSTSWVRLDLGPVYQTLCLTHFWILTLVANINWNFIFVSSLPLRLLWQQTAHFMALSMPSTTNVGGTKQHCDTFLHLSVCTMTLAQKWCTLELDTNWKSNLLASVRKWQKRLVLLRYPKPTPKPRFFAKTVRRRNLGFSAIIDGFWAHLHAEII